jgi:hypothetical protein
MGIDRGRAKGLSPRAVHFLLEVLLNALRFAVAPPRAQATGEVQRWQAKQLGISVRRRLDRNFRMWQWARAAERQGEHYESESHLIPNGNVRCHKQRRKCEIS